MTTETDLAAAGVQATDGAIAANNLRSTLAQSWNRFWQAGTLGSPAVVLL